MMTLEEKYKAAIHTLRFYAEESHYVERGNSLSVQRDGGQRAREQLEILNERYKG